jgi:hypothetical protein
MKAILIALSVSAALVLGTSIAVAQYPQAGGSVTLTSASVNATLNGQVPLTCTVRDGAGAAVANTPCTIAIESQPGTDAAVGSLTITKMTDANGVATTTLRTGSTAGQIVVSATSGSFRSVTVVTVAGSSAAPPAAPVVVPPSPGDGGLIK